MSVEPALEFDDHELAARNLAAMRVRSSVMVAALYTSDGRLYASYARDPQSTPPAAAPPLGESVAGERVELSRPILRDGERLGTIYLRARYDVHSRIAAYAAIFGLVMASSLAVSYALSRRLQRAITDPLNAMTGAARQIVSHRDYSLRASKTTDDEIGIAVLAFNGMLDEVEARVRASESANAALQTEVRVRHAAEAALRDADRRKDEFLATLAHELRNPLAPIRHAVRLLDANGANEQQQQWGRAVIGRQVQRMALLLDDLLDVSRITRGLLQLKSDVVDLRSVVQDALEVAQPLNDAKCHQLRSAVLPPEPVILSCDPLRLSQALSNLLTNAAKYTDRNGRIGLTVALSEAELTMSVKDSGIVIPIRERSPGFSRFLAAGFGARSGGGRVGHRSGIGQGVGGAARRPRRGGECRPWNGQRVHHSPAALGGGG